jgi:hypothetical protein
MDSGRRQLRRGVAPNRDNRILRLGSGSEQLETGLPIPGTHAPERMPSSSSFLWQGQEWDHTSFAARWADVLTIVDGHSICPPKLGGVAADGAVLVRPHGYVGFTAQARLPQYSFGNGSIDGFAVRWTRSDQS